MPPGVEAQAEGMRVRAAAGLDHLDKRIVKCIVEGRGEGGRFWKGGGGGGGGGGSGGGRYAGSAGVRKCVAMRQLDLKEAEAGHVE